MENHQESSQVPQDESNILHEPQRADSDLEDELMETQSVSTVVGASTNYKTDLDPKLFSAQKIRCCMCGVMIEPNLSNTCVNCLKKEFDITEGITKTGTLQHCKECDRYLRPPWINCQPESPELLALCLKNIKGLKKVKLVDSGFLWTEPHSKRVKVKLTIQKEVLDKTILKQTFPVEFVVNNQQCDDCKKTYTPHLWSAIVQVRQRVDHKRTFLFLEQLIIKHNAVDKCIGIKEVHEGLDFQFKTKSDAQKLTDFIANTVPTQVKQSKQLISQDLKNNTYNYKYSTSIEIAPVCKDDLVILPQALSKKLGGIGPMVLVYKISNSVQIVDIYNMHTYEIDQVTYWKYQFQALCGRDRLKEFVVINIDNVDYHVSTSRAALKQQFKMVQAEVQRKEDFGVNDKTFLVNTHLGESLNYNDTVLGYDLDMMNMTDLEDNQNLKREVPSVVLVKKTYPKYRKKNRKHNKFQLKQLQKETVDENNLHKKDKSNLKHQRDYELFMQDILEDTEIRNQIDLYKTGAQKKVNGDDDEVESVEEDFPIINEVDLKTIDDKLANLNLHEADLFEESKIN